MNKIGVILLTAFLSLSGCETFDAYTGEKKASATAKGAGIGAGIAATLAYMRNKDKSSSTRKKRMLEAAGIGALAGGGIGYYMDKQEADLRKRLRNTGVSVNRNGPNINLVMPGNITFASNGASLNSNFNTVLDSVVLVLQEYKQTLIMVAGHTDSVGSEQYNETLSGKRAGSVTQYLAQQGVETLRLEKVGFGEQAPIANNATAEGRALNRRVELSLLPITIEP